MQITSDDAPEQFISESPFSSRQFFNFDTSSKLPRHRWYYFKEGFSSALVEEAINHVEASSKAKRKLSILDPFCGSGTTPLVASLLGHSAVGIEVNPFLAFVSRTKTQSGIWQRSNFLRKLEQIIDASTIEHTSPLEEYSTFGKREDIKKWLFNKTVLRKYASLVHAIEKMKCAYSDAFLLAALVAAFDCSNAKRDGKGLRYKRNWKDRNYSDLDVINRFKEHALMIIDDVQQCVIKSENHPRIINADSRQEINNQEADSFDLVVTSPPYLNSFDYSDVYRPELFLGNYVKDTKELAKLRLSTVRSHIQVNWPPQTSVESVLLTPILQKLDKVENLWNARLPSMVKAYFDDLNIVIHGLADKLRANGQFWMVVSTSAYGGVHIPVDFILAELACNAGFTLESIHKLRDLRTSSQQSRQLNATTLPLRESLIILKRA